MMIHISFDQQAVNSTPPHSQDSFALLDNMLHERAADDDDFDVCPIVLINSFSQSIWFSLLVSVLQGSETIGKKAVSFAPIMLIGREDGDMRDRKIEKYVDGLVDKGWVEQIKLGKYSHMANVEAWLDSRDVIVENEREELGITVSKVFDSMAAWEECEKKKNTCDYCIFFPENVFLSVFDLRERIYTALLLADRNALHWGHVRFPIHSSHSFGWFHIVMFFGIALILNFLFGASNLLAKHSNHRRKLVFQMRRINLCCLIISLLLHLKSLSTAGTHIQFLDASDDRPGVYLIKSEMSASLIDAAKQPFNSTEILYDKKMSLWQGIQKQANVDDVSRTHFFSKPNFRNYVFEPSIFSALT
jgi:hypothetical protein